MTVSSLPFTGTGTGGTSSSNKYSFNPAVYTASAAFTPLCTGTNVVVTGVTTAATAYDWFALISAGTNILFTTYGSMPVTTTTGIMNKAFVASIANNARTAMLPLVKQEYFLGTLAPSLISLVTNGVTSCSNDLTSLQVSSLDTATKTAISTAYTADLALITASLNRLKTLENKIYLVGDSIDVTSSATNTAYAALATASTFAKVFLSNLFDPAYLGNGGTAIPALTATTFANAGTVQAMYATAATALSGSTLLKQLQAETEMAAQTTFDLNCAMIQGYTSAGTSGNYATASAPVGLVPGIDYEVHLAGTMMSAQLTADSSTITAAQSVVGAPSVTTIFW